MSSPNIRPLTPGMRQMLLAASLLVFLIGIPLYLLSTRTESFFAWTIHPPLTAAFLGAAYWSSCALEFLASRERVWAHGRIAVPAVLLFTALTLVVTLFHLDVFHFDSPGWHTRAGTWAWLIVYATVPVIMGILLLIQRGLPGDDPPRLAPLPAWARGLLYGQATIMILPGLALLLATASTAPLWPWELKPLAARAFGAWLLSIGVAAAHAAWENDWQRIRPFVVSYLLLGGLQLVALVRFAGDVAWNRPTAWLYVLFLLSILGFGFYGWQELRKHKELRITLGTP